MNNKQNDPTYQALVAKRKQAYDDWRSAKAVLSAATKEWHAAGTPSHGVEYICLVMADKGVECLLERAENLDNQVYYYGYSENITQG